MNYKLFLTILLILTAITTIFLCIARPNMHKSVLVYSSEFKIVPQSEIKVEVANIPTITVVDNKSISQNQELNIEADNGINVVKTNIIPVNSNAQDINIFETQPVQSQKIVNQGLNIAANNNKNIISNQNITPQKVTTQGININSNKQTSKFVTTTPVKQQVKINTPQLENTNIKTTSPQIDIQKILDNNKKIQAANQQAKTAPVSVAPVQTANVPNRIAQTPVRTTTPRVATQTVTPKPVNTYNVPKVQPQQTIKVLTPQEEEIAWQVWRSNLQNKIMQDVRLPNVPQGTTFKFSFDVDRYGKISNVHTTSTNSAYTPYAIQYIAPVIKSYQGRSILNFPAGSRRATTEFIGSFRINNTSNKYSTTQDYRDTERIVR